ncbi:MAG TPA: hypothetical protein VNZ44_09760 [Pyrinomonadaceae bacterium]|nr:hypothetical protein [Pyrinomonadaceae bacterium]
MSRLLNSFAGASRRVKVLSAGCLLLALGGVAAGAGGWLRPSPSRAPSHAAAAPQGRKKAVLPSASVTLTPRGFEPSELSVGGVKFFLSVENRSGVRGLTLRLDPEHGNRVREFTQPEDELDWVEELGLTPGSYTLSVAGRPGWVCRVNVAAH